MSGYNYTDFQRAQGLGGDPENVLWVAKRLSTANSKIDHETMSEFLPYTTQMSEGRMTLIRDMTGRGGFILVTIAQVSHMIKLIRRRRNYLAQNKTYIPIGLKEAFIETSPSCEEIIKWNVKPNRFIIDVDCALDVPELFIGVSKEIDNFERRYNFLTKSIKQEHVTDFVQRDKNVMVMLACLTEAMYESLKVMKRLYGTIDHLNAVDEGVCIRATHYTADGSFIANPRKWSFHLNYKNVIVTNNRMAKVFGCLIRVFLVTWYFGKKISFSGITSDDIPSSYNDIVRFIAENEESDETYPCAANMFAKSNITVKKMAEMNLKCDFYGKHSALKDRVYSPEDDDDGTLYYASVNKEGYTDYSYLTEDENILGPFDDPEHQAHVGAHGIQSIIDMQLYATSHNIRMPGCTKPGEDRYSQIISVGYTEMDAMATVYNYNSLHPTETILIDENDEDDDDDTVDITDGKRTASRVSINDSFVDEAIDKVLEKHPNFEFRCMVPKKDGSLFINFDRLEPDTHVCGLCDSKKPHERDNTLFMTISADDEGTRFANLFCIKSQTKGANRKRQCIAVSGKDKATMDVRIKKSLDATKKNRYSVLFDETDYTGQFDDNFTYVVTEDKRKITHKDFLSSTVTYMLAGMGIGKTVTLIDFIKKHKDRKFIILSNRIALTNEVVSKMNKAMPSEDEHFMSYQDTKERITNFNRLVIQTESLNRVSIDTISKSNFILILDESESIIKQFASNTHRDNLNKNMLMFFFMIFRARNVIALDATMTMATHNVIKSVMDDYHRPNVSYTFYKNQCKTQNDTTFNITGSRNSWLSKLMHSLRNGHKCVVAMNTKNVARSLKLAIEAEFANKIRIGHYDSETLASVKRKHFSNVNKYWKEYDVLLYTPTAGAGISFEEAHYDYLFGYFVSGSCDAESCIQLLGRVRNISKKEAYIYVDPIKQNVRTTKASIIASRLSTFAKDINGPGIEADRIGDDGLLQYRMTPKLELQLTNLATKNRSRKDLFDRIVRILSIYCDNVKLYVPETNIKSYDFTVFIEKNKILLAEAIDEAPPITGKTFNEIKDKSMAGDDIGTTERRSVDKYMLGNLYNIEQTAMNYDFILKFNTDKEKEHCYNLCSVANPGDLQESIGLMTGARRANLINKTRDLSNMLMDTNIISKIDPVIDTIKLLTMIGVNTIKKALTVYLDEYYYRREEIYDICDSLVGKLENKSLTRLLSKRLFNETAETFAEALGKFLKELLKVIFGMNVVCDNVKVIIYRRTDYEYQSDIMDRAKSTEPRPKMMAMKTLLPVYYYDRFLDEESAGYNAYVDLADDEEEYSIGDIAQIKKYADDHIICAADCARENNITDYVDTNPFRGLADAY